MPKQLHFDGEHRDSQPGTATIEVALCAYYCLARPCRKKPASPSRAKKNNGTHCSQAPVGMGTPEAVTLQEHSSGTTQPLPLLESVCGIGKTHVTIPDCAKTHAGAHVGTPEPVTLQEHSSGTAQAMPPPESVCGIRKTHLTIPGCAKSHAGAHRRGHR